MLRLFLLATVTGLLAQSPEELLSAADRHRHPWPAFRVDIRLQVGRETQAWRVHARENGDARVEGLSPKEKGRSVLVLGDDMYLLLPDAKRPVKVSPQQRLLGPASGGDIARSRFADDYQAVLSGEEVVEGEPCHRLDLQAKRPLVAFQKATLWVAKAGRRPVKAEFRMASGKLGRTVRFREGAPIQGRSVLRAMEVEASSGRLELTFKGWSPEAADPELFRLPPAP